MIFRSRTRHRVGVGVGGWPLVAVGGALAGGSALVTSVVRDGDNGAAVTVPIAVAVGVLIGMVAAWFVGRAGALVRSRRDLDRLTPAPNLAVIPRHPLGAERPDDVVMLRDPKSIDAEAYRTLRTSFEFVVGRSNDPSGRGTVVLVTSPRPGEGKSSVAANLAAASAMAGRRVALVDGDLRQPQIHRLFRLGNTAGLTSVLARNGKLIDAVQRLDGTANLIVLSAGPPPPDPAEMLNGARLGGVLAGLAEGSDLVVIDAPPLLAVADPAIIAQHCDGVLMVATADLTAKSEWTEALARLAVVEATIIGTVLLEPDDRIRAVPTYRYAPSAVPQNWWVTPETSGSDKSGGGVVTGLRVVGGIDAAANDAAESTDDGGDELSQLPPGH